MPAGRQARVTRWKGRSRTRLSGNDFLAIGITAKLLDHRTHSRRKAAVGSQLQILLIGHQGLFKLLLLLQRGPQKLIDNRLRIRKLRQRFTKLRFSLRILASLFEDPGEPYMSFRLKSPGFADRPAKRL